MNKQWIIEAHERIFPEPFDYVLRIRYSRRFKAFNANIRLSDNALTFSFSHYWKYVGKEIVIGLVQELLLKLKGKKAVTANTRLYNSFIQNLHIATPKLQIDSRLKELFDRVNSQYFNNRVELANLQWGGESTRRLAAYDYHTDTITVSSHFKEADEQLLSYLVFHEMLHKELKFNNSNGRNIHHSREFRERERQFQSYAEIEKRINCYANREKSPGFLRRLL